ncbi:hypothetical protein BJ508DRAFT_377259 [Ascobolus immersus RN42]|uniref:Uncharacterized protein n=1 Tax=Ascobolus immersus RN42 TaxID=1160509 RepID=A0A3N4I1Q4_ASCIM|nr:hypothetical protein BJ508DRAFT_377259 [Ascobolus immersus RN42]
MEHYSGNGQVSFRQEARVLQKYRIDQQYLSIAELHNVKNLAIENKDSFMGGRLRWTKGKPEPREVHVLACNVHHQLPSTVFYVALDALKNEKHQLGTFVQWKNVNCCRQSAFFFEQTTAVLGWNKQPHKVRLGPNKNKTRLARLSPPNQGPYDRSSHSKVVDSNKDIAEPVPPVYYMYYQQPPPAYQQPQPVEVHQQLQPVQHQAPQAENQAPQAQPQAQAQHQAPQVRNGAPQTQYQAAQAYHQPPLNRQPQPYYGPQKQLFLLDMRTKEAIPLPVSPFYDDIEMEPFGFHELLEEMGKLGVAGLRTLNAFVSQKGREDGVDYHVEWLYVEFDDIYEGAIIVGEEVIQVFVELVAY